jgi:hypothetical protein
LDAANSRKALKHLSLQGFHGCYEIAYYGWNEGAGHQFSGPNYALDLWPVKRISPKLLRSLDNVCRDLDSGGELAAVDTFTAQALDLITSSRVREAFDISRESEDLIARYGQKGAKFEYNKSPVEWDYEAFLRARQLVEAGVPYVSLQVGLWDHHGGDQPYTPQNVLATLYHVLGIDPATTLPDHNGRPIYLLDERNPIRELV